MASVGQITASLVAQTQRFTRPLLDAQKQLTEFNRRADAVKKRLDQISQAGKWAGIALASLGGTVGLMVRNASQTADAFDTMAKQIGITVEQAQALTFAAERQNADMATLQTGLRGFARRTAEAARGNESFAKEFRRLGIEITDAEGRIRPIYDLLFEVADAVSELGTEAEASAALMNLMSDAGRKLVPLMRSGGAAIRGLVQEAEALDLIIPEEQIELINEFQDALDMLGLRIKTAGIRLAADFIPALKIVVEWANRVLDAFAGLSDETRRQIIVWSTVTAAVLSAIVVFTIVAKAVAGVIAVVKLLGKIIIALTSPFGLVVLAFLAGIVLIVAAIQKAREAWENNWLGIRDAVLNAWDRIQEIIDQVVEFGEKTLETAWNWIVEAAGNFWDWSRGPAKDWISNTVTTVWNWVVEAAGTFWSWLTGPAKDWIQGAVSTTWNFITGTIPETLNRILQWFGKAAETVWNIGTGGVEKIIEYIANTIDRMSGSFETVWAWTIKGLDPVIKTVNTLLGWGEAAVDWFKGVTEKFQRGGILPGSGGPDSILALLAPGEAVIPFSVWRRGLDAIAEWFRRQGVPGFQEGGIAEGRRRPPRLTESLANISRSVWGEAGSLLEFIMDSMRAVAKRVLGEERVQEITDFFATIQEEIGRFFDALVGVSEDARDTARRPGGPDDQIGTWQKLTAWAKRTIQSATAFFKEELEAATEHVKQFGIDILRTLSPLGLVSSLVTSLGRSVQTLLFPIQMVADVVATALLPAFQSVFPVIKVFAQILLLAAHGIAVVWNALMDFISLLPFINLRNWLIDIDALVAAQRDLADLTWEEAEARAHNIETLEQSTQALRNVPRIFRAALRTGQAAGATALQPMGGVRAPSRLGQVWATALPMTEPAGEGSTVEININITGPVYGMRDFEQQVHEALARALRRAGLAETGLVVKLS